MASRLAQPTHTHQLIRVGREDYFSYVLLLLASVACTGAGDVGDAGEDAPVRDSGVDGELLDAAGFDVLELDVGPSRDGSVDARVDPTDASDDAGDTAVADPDDRILVCGGPVVLMLAEEDVDAGDPTPLFEWRAADHPEIPSAVRDELRSLDECKPFAGGLVAVSSDAGGVALFEYPSGNVVFWGDVRNAHSVELLPGGLVAVAAANDNALLVLFELDDPGVPIQEIDFFAAHGLVWDDARSVLWASGHDRLRSFSIDGRRLVEESDVMLPDRGAHDLRPVVGTTDLVLSTRADAWFFDRETGEFRVHPVLAEVFGIKGIDVHPTSGRTVYVQADSGTFWSPRFRLLDPAATIEMPGERLYKARWVAGLLPE